MKKHLAMVEMEQNSFLEKISDTEELIAEIKKFERYQIIAYLFAPFIVGIFILKHVNNRIKEFEDEIYSILKNVKHHLIKESNHLKKRTNELEDEVYSISKNIKHNLLKELNHLKTSYDKIEREDTYLTYSEKTRLLNYCNTLLQNINLLVNNQNLFSSEIITCIENTLSEIEEIFEKIEKYNGEFIERRKQEYDYLFKKNPFPLDDNQKTAIVTDDKHNLVVAGAGSGKTEVIVNRIAYLIEREPDTVQSNRILALAFQRDASNEMKERLKKRYGHEIEIRTFHSLGLDILKKAGEHSNVYGGDNHDSEQNKLLKELIENAKQSSIFQNSIINYMKFIGTEDKIKEEVDFKTKEEFYEYQKQLQYIALDGTGVKSIGELTILNFFLSHRINGKNITVHYESYADWMEYTDERGRKQTPAPDFYLPEYEIYIEHWSLDKNGDVPSWYDKDKYIRTMNLKKEKFNENNKILVETTFGEFVNNPDFEQILQDRIHEALTNSLSEEKISITSIPYYELVEKVWDECKSHIKALPSNISSFIRNAKTYRLTPESIRKRLEHEKWSPKQIAFCHVAIRIYEDYERTLHSEGAIDFEDMINLAVDTLKNHDDLNHDVYDHILIDEYQDISKQRYELIKMLMDKNPSCKLFCVGDDWQSIMGFAGSNPEFFVHFDKYFAHPAITYLTYNYRSISSIVETGNDIIKNNKGIQIDKKVVSIVEERRPIKVFSSLHKGGYKKQYFQQIADHCMKTINELLSNGYTNKDIMVLTRIYKNPIFNDCFEEFAIRKRIRYFSVHKSKGLQAKVVIILNVDKGLYGFPCELRSPTILEPARIENNFDKEVEERRLFYVAVTRAKEDVIIYSQNCAHSKFLDEISNHITIEKLTY